MSMAGVAPIERPVPRLARAPLAWFPSLMGIPFHRGAEIVDILGRSRVEAGAPPLTPQVMGPIEKLSAQMWPGVPVVPLLLAAGTDAKPLIAAGIPTYGVDGTFGDIDDVRAHGRDERVGVKQYFEGLEFQYRLIKLLSK